MISHQEAEVLISARQDAPLDPIVERELQAHLATCDNCRAFAIATEKLTAGVRGLPTIAANPRVKREVMERVRAGRNPLAGLLGGFGNGFQPGPAIAAVALIAVVGLFGWFALDRVIFDDGDGDNQIAAVPTEQVTRESAEPTQTSVAETAVPTAVAPTDVPPTDVPPTDVPPTDVPPTEVPPTDVPPTEVPPTVVPPTEVPLTEVPPTDVPPTEMPPTAEPESTEMAGETEDEGPTDLTTMSQLDSTPEAPASAGVTETAIATPTETVVPTEIPATPTPVPPTATPAPTEVVTETEIPATAEAPTETPDVGDVPPIEPIEGSTSVPVDDQATETPIGDGTGGTEIPVGTETTGDGVIEQIDDTDDQSAGTSEAEGDPADIELIAPDGEAATTDVTPESGETDEGATAESTVETTDEATGQPLLDVSEIYQGIEGDPAGKLGLTPEGRMEFMMVPDGASMMTPDGYQMRMADAQPGVVQLCSDAGCEPSTEAPADVEAEGWRGDVPLGYLDGTVYWMRLYDSTTEIYTSVPSGTQLVESSLVLELGPTDAPSAVYLNGSSLYAWLPTGEWLIMSGNSAQAVSGSYATPVNVRFAPTPDLIGYFSGGTLIVAPAGAPDQAILTLPAEGIDFDISPPGDQIALIEGNNIVIYDTQGNVVSVYHGGDTQPGSVLWLNSGVVWVDRNNGQLYQIPETAP